MIAAVRTTTFCERGVWPAFHVRCPGPLPVYPRSHERKLLRSRLCVELGTLYRREGDEEESTGER
jgi:hypothetical protein